jgi:hypothetical protein
LSVAFVVQRIHSVNHAHSFSSEAADEVAAIAKNEMEHLVEKGP